MEPKPNPADFTHNGELQQPHYDNAVRAWEKLERKQKAVDFTVSQIREAYCRIRKIDHTIPDDILDLMKDAAIEKLRSAVSIEKVGHNEIFDLVGLSIKYREEKYDQIAIGKDKTQAITASLHAQVGFMDGFRAGAELANEQKGKEVGESVKENSSENNSELIKELQEADATLNADNYKSWCQVRLAISSAIKALQEVSLKCDDNSTSLKIQTCKVCGIFAFTIDGRSCMNGHNIK